MLFSCQEVRTSRGRRLIKYWCLTCSILHCVSQPIRSAWLFVALYIYSSAQYDMQCQQINLVQGDGSKNIWYHQMLSRVSKGRVFLFWHVYHLEFWEIVKMNLALFVKAQRSLLCWAIFHLAVVFYLHWTDKLDLTVLYGWFVIQKNLLYIWDKSYVALMHSKGPFQNK